MNDVFMHRMNVPVKTPSRALFWGKALGVLLLLGLGLGGALRLAVNQQQQSQLHTYTAQTLERRVLTSRAKPADLKRNLALPSSLRGNNEAVIYARTTGYVAAWHKGIGDRVTQGELLAELDAPEQTQELAQARAQRDQVAARAEFARQTLARWEALPSGQSAVSAQELAEKRSLAKQNSADLAAAEANVKRLEQLEQFRRIKAPFSGILTRRDIEIGDLVASTGKELFTITQTDPLRLRVWVPQAYAGNLQLGAKVKVSLAEQPAANLQATIERIAGGIDPTTRTRQVDLVLPNPKGSLLPGAYAEVGIALSSPVKALVAPSATLIVTDQTQRIAVVDDEQRIRFRNVKLGRDLGRDVEVLDGISLEDRLVVSPPDQLVEGDKVIGVAWAGTAENANKGGANAGAKTGESGDKAEANGAKPVDTAKPVDGTANNAGGKGAGSQ